MREVSEAAPTSAGRLHAIVANVSEGRDLAAINRMAQCIRDVADVVLLDVHHDADHDRTVFTFCSSSDTALIEATLELARAALSSIDLHHPNKNGSLAGVHPKIGALDVVPVVPISGSATIKSAAAIATEISQRLGRTLGLPVHRYGAIARSAERRSLSLLRRGGVDALAALHAMPTGAPDDGPTSPHQTGGAVAVGARPVMVAWNIELAPSPQPEQLATSLTHAQQIANEIRGARAGGVAGLQALGFPLVRRGCAQVSMNLHDAFTAAERGDTLHAIRARVAVCAAAYGETIGATEVVGLVPERLLFAGGDPEALAIRGGWASASLERRLSGETVA